MLSQPNPPDQLKPKIIRSFELGLDLERENDGEKYRQWGLGRSAMGLGVGRWNRLAMRERVEG